MDITLDDVLTILEEHCNNVKALDALNQELFQMCIDKKKTVSDWGVHLLRHLQILVASFPECFPPEHITKLKCDQFYSGLLKWLKAMLAYLKASANEKMYFDYLWVAREAEKEEVMEPSYSQTTDKPSKPKATSFFPLWKLKGTQPTKIPAIGTVHLEEEGSDDQAKRTPGGDAQSIGWHKQTPFLKPDPFLQWYGVKNIAKVRINGVSCITLLNNDVQINMVTPQFIEECSLDVGPLKDLVGRLVTCVGLGYALTQSLGYVIIPGQVNGFQGYDEDQRALVIPDMSKFVIWVQVILGTPTISWVVNVMKEKEIDALATPWVNAWVAYLLAVRQATATIEDFALGEQSDPNDYDEIVTTKETETINTFSSWVIHAKTKTAHWG